MQRPTARHYAERETLGTHTSNWDVSIYSVPSGLREHTEEEAETVQTSEEMKDTKGPGPLNQPSKPPIVSQRLKQRAEGFHASDPVPCVYIRDFSLVFYTGPECVDERGSDSCIFFLRLLLICVVSLQCDSLCFSLLDFILKCFLVIS